MTRKNLNPDKDQELLELIASYEAAKADNKQLYLDGDQLADIADKYATDRRFEEAQKVITYGLELHPGHTDLLIQQAYLYLDTMQLQQAKNVAECISESYETSVKILKAEILLNEGNLDEAEKELATIEDKEELDTIIDVAYLYMDMGFSEKALPWLTHGLEKYIEEEDFLVAVADCYRAGNQDERAAYFYNKLIDKNPYNSSYWTGLAKCHFNQQDYDKTIEACDFALAADENFGEAHLMKAHSLFHLENEFESIEEYQKALLQKSLPPEFIYMFIGLAYANVDKWEFSFQSCEKALEFIGNEDSPILTDIYSNQAYCMAKLGKFKEAHEYCNKAREKSPESADTYLQEGRIYLEEDKFDEAKECWRFALNYAPEAETLVQIGNYSLDYGMVENARLCFEEARKQDPDYPGINTRLASVCILLRDHKGFYKYNKLSESPLNLNTLFDTISQSNDTGLLNELQKFVQEIEDEESEEEDDEFTEEKTK